MTTTILAALQTYIKTYSGIGSNGIVLVDALNGNPNEFSISPQPGVRIIETDIAGGSTRQFNFALQMIALTADDATRLANSGFFEGVADWFESQTLAGVFTGLTLNSNQHPTIIEAVSQPFLYQQGESETAIYQMTCRIEYDQDKP
jgi:hypothetical protein